MLLSRNMMEYTSGENKVLGSIVKRERHACEVQAVETVDPPCLGDLQAPPRDIRERQGCLGEVATQKGSRGANTAPEI
jgi:hypothetical protein